MACRTAIRTVATESKRKLTGFIDLFIVAISKMIYQTYTMSARSVQRAHEGTPLTASNSAAKTAHRMALLLHC
jgi:hypothetical protein